ncbi:MAG TPA: GNAT family N-acetyltransferase [Solirubrobacteraceae bacterium]|jgi:ribosomal protein S18 acetylase RimI-like enzyme
MHSVERATYEELCGVVSELEAFWGSERDMGFLHQALYFQEFGDTAFTARADDGAVDGYLLGFLGPQLVGYIHGVAVRDGHRGEGLARSLYDAFERAVSLRGAVALKAITDPSNASSIAFHRALGFSATEVEAYTLTGVSRMVFYKQLPSG